MKQIFNVAKLMPGKTPMRALMVGDYGSRPWQKLDVNFNSLDEAVARLRPELNLTFEDGSAFKLVFTSIDDFEPSIMVQRSEYFKSLTSAMNTIRNIASGAHATLIDPKNLARWVSWKKPPNINMLWIDYNRLRDLLLKQISEVLADEAFLLLERNWMAVKQLLQALKEDQLREDQPEAHYQITLLNLSQTELQEDLNSVSTITDTELYSLIYSDELGQFGGIPYHIISLQYEAKDNQNDVDILSHFSAIANAAQCILSLPVSADFYNDPTISDDPLSQPRFHRWSAYLEQLNSRYVLLTAGSYIYRESYEYEEVAPGIGFNEQSANLCWAPIHNWHIYEMARSHQLVGTGLATGQGVNLLQYLPQLSNTILNIRLTPEQQHNLADLGINTPEWSTYRIGFNSRFQMRGALASVKSARLTSPLDQHTELLLLQNQLSRHLKLLVRETLGHGNPEEVKALANQWLSPFIKGPGHISRSQWVRQPLESAIVNILENDQGNPVLDIVLTAHIPDQDDSVSLNLNWAS